MPTTTNKEYQKIKPLPDDITPNTEVFYNISSNEIFEHYDDYFKRMIQLTSTSWTCAITGKGGLTYDEALQSEKDAIEQINNFPAFLETPILFIMHKYTSRGRIDEVVSDIMAFMHDRYFMDEEVIYRHTSHKRYPSRIIGIDYHQDDSNSNDKANKSRTSFGGKATPSKATSKSPTKKGNDQIGTELCPAECFTYTLQILKSSNNSVSSSDDSDEDDEEEDNKGSRNTNEKDKMPGHVFNIPHTQIGRNRAIATRPRIKLFIRYYAEMAMDGRLIVKPNFVGDFNLDSLRWSQIFCKSPEPKFPQTRSNNKIRMKEDDRTSLLNANERPGTSKSGGGESGSRKANVEKGELRKKRIMEQQILLEPLFKQGFKMAYRLLELVASFSNYGQKNSTTDIEMAAARCGVKNLQNWQQYSIFLSEEDIQNLRLTIAKAKEMERKKQVDQRRREREAQNEWKKPRDDLQCDDLQPFPPFKPVIWPNWIPREHYWDIISICSFFSNFAEVLFSDRISPFTLGNVATAIVSRHAIEKSQFYQILDWLMVAVNKCIEEDEGAPADLSRPEHIGREQNIDIDHPIHGQSIRNINKECEKQKRIHGVHMYSWSRSLLDLTEIIRIHLLTSGFYTQYRRHRGQMHCYEDDGYVFTKIEPEIMELLEKSTVFALSPNERIKLINVMINQLLSHSRCRELIDKRTEELNNLKRDFRHLKTVDQQHEKEAREAHQLLEQQNKANSVENGQTGNSKTNSKDLINLRRALFQMNEGRRVQNIGEFKERMLDEQNPLPWAQMENCNEIVEFRAAQRNFHIDKMQELLRKIYELQGKMGMFYFGRDRAFRRYYYMFSAFIIKCPKAGKELGECGQATPLKIKMDEEIGNEGGEEDVKMEEVGSNENNEKKKEIGGENDGIGNNVNGLEMLTKIDQLMACTGSMQTCPVHNPPPDSPELLYYMEKDAPKKLFQCLNPRGFREMELAENIGLFKEIYTDEMNATEKFIEERKNHLPISSQLFGFLTSSLPKELTNEKDSRIADVFLGEVKNRLLELEETIHERKLGILKCKCGREQWRKCLEENGDTTKLCAEDGGIPILNSTTNHGEYLYTNEELESTTPVQKLGIALIQLAHSIHPDCMHTPFISEVKKNGEVIKRNPTRTFDEWQRVLKHCQSPSAVGLFMSTFEYAVNWEFNQTEEKEEENLTTKIGRRREPKNSAPSSSSSISNNSSNKPSTSRQHHFREAAGLMANAAGMLVTGTRQVNVILVKQDVSRKPVTKYGECEMDIDKLDFEDEKEEQENGWSDDETMEDEETEETEEDEQMIMPKRQLRSTRYNNNDDYLNEFGAERYEGLGRKRKPVTHFDPTIYHHQVENNKRKKGGEEMMDEDVEDESRNGREEDGQQNDEEREIMDEGELEEWQ